jgi:hypothetical protein
MDGKLESNQAINNIINDKKCQYFSKEKLLYSSKLTIQNIALPKQGTAKYIYED